MVKKFRPGLSDTFTLDVAPIADLGDYLDEPGPSPVAPGRVGEGVVPPRPVTPSPVQKVIDVSLADSEPQAPIALPATSTGTPRASPAHRAPAAPVAQPAQQPTAQKSRGPRHTGPRREINMSPEAFDMSDELLDLIRGGGGQRDTKANELMHALLLLAYEVKDEIDPHSLPKRGRWGTPTARAYPLEIKNALLQAIRRKHPAVS